MPRTNILAAEDTKGYSVVIKGLVKLIVRASNESVQIGTNLGRGGEDMDSTGRSYFRLLHKVVAEHLPGRGCSNGQRKCSSALASRKEREAYPFKLG